MIPLIDLLPVIDPAGLAKLNQQSTLLALGNHPSHMPESINIATNLEYLKRTFLA